MNKRALFSMILIAVLLVSCGRAGRPPLVYLISNGELVDGFQSSYCWDNGARGTLCVDSIEPFFEGSTSLPRDAPIQVQLDSPLPDSLTLSLSREVFGDTLVSESVPVSEIVQWSPAVDAGEYILAVSPRWEQGEVTYWFSISLE